jgi:hypothetical protein
VDFCRAIVAYFGKLYESEYFSASFPSLVGVQNPLRDINMAIKQELGADLNLFQREYYTPPTTLDLIVFFYQFVSKPINYDIYDEDAGKAEYTKIINNMFDQFKLLFFLDNGLIKELKSEILDEAILKLDFIIPDAEVEKLIRQAIEKFYSRDADERIIAVEKIVDAYERIATLEDKDKKKSLQKMYDKIIAGDSAKGKILKDDFTLAWNSAHDFTIRHKGTDRALLQDKDCVEYLFYTYFNIVRFILVKYEYTKKSE